jgi:hypothetical protein
MRIIVWFLSTPIHIWDFPYRFGQRAEAVFFCGIGKYMLLYSDKVAYTFLPFVREEKLARRCQTLLFRCGAVWCEGRIRVAIVPIIEIPRCFATPTFIPHSGRFASLPKKDERQRPRVFLIHDTS